MMAGAPQCAQHYLSGALGPGFRLLPVTVGGAAVLYVLHDDHAFRFVDPVQDAPPGTRTCAVEAG
jgi:hypothetical protein